MNCPCGAWVYDGEPDCGECGGAVEDLSCGCPEYHLADCPLITDRYAEPSEEEESWWTA